jgi:hypothetical protein
MLKFVTRLGAICYEQLVLNITFYGDVQILLITWKTLAYMGWRYLLDLKAVWCVYRQLRDVFQRWANENTAVARQIP